MSRTLLCIIIVLMLIMVFIWPLSSSIGLGCFSMVIILIIISIIRNDRDMKTFRIVKQWVKIGENEHVRYKLEQRHHFMWIFHWWKAPSFAPEPFRYTDVVIQCVRDKYPDAVVLDCYSEPKVGG